MSLDIILEEKNARNLLFGRPELTFPLDVDGVSELSEYIDGMSAPEIVTCDGEISAEDAKGRWRELTQAAIELQNHAQRSGYPIPTFSEL